MSALNRPVDVLARLRRHKAWLCNFLRNVSFAQEAEASVEADEVIAAVAELIEAAKQISNLYGHLWDVTEPVGAGFLSPESVAKYDAAHERLHAALAAVEGQS